MTRIVRAQGGALWEDVDDAAWAHHLAVVGGTFGDTGVAGLALGGGIGWLSGLAGFTCDNLVRAELVTAAGERVVAGPDGDPDLLWALRGGGGNFGVVTSFEFRAIDPVRSWPAISRYPLHATRQVLRRLAEVASTAPGRPRAHGDGRISQRGRPATRPGRGVLAGRPVDGTRGPPAAPGRAAGLERYGRPDGLPRDPGDERTAAVRLAALLEGPFPQGPRRAADRRRGRGDGRQAGWPERDPARSHPRGGADGAAGWHGVRPAGRGLERQRPRDLGRPGRATTRTSPGHARPRIGSRSVRGAVPGTPTTRRSTRRTSASGSRSGRSDSSGSPGSRHATTRTTGCGST